MDTHLLLNINRILKIQQPTNNKSQTGGAGYTLTTIPSFLITFELPISKKIITIDTIPLSSISNNQNIINYINNYINKNKKDKIIGRLNSLFKNEVRKNLVDKIFTIIKKFRI